MNRLRSSAVFVSEHRDGLHVRDFRTHELKESEPFSFTLTGLERLLGEGAHSHYSRCPRMLQPGPDLHLVIQSVVGRTPITAHCW